MEKHREREVRSDKPLLRLVSKVAGQPGFATLAGIFGILATSPPEPFLRLGISRLFSFNPSKDNGSRDVRRTLESGALVKGMHSAGAIHTVRAIYLDDPVPLEYLGLDGCNQLEECEHRFRVELEGTGGLPMLEKVVYEGYDSKGVSMFRYQYEGNKTSIANETLVKFAHEYSHWMMLKGTMMASVIEELSWRMRVLRLILCEQIHQCTGIERSFSARTAKRISDDFESYSKKLGEVADDDSQQRIFVDLVRTQHALLFFYQPAITTLVEPVTWALTETEKWGSDALGRYFPVDEGAQSEEQKLASVILCRSREYVGDRKGRERLIKAVRKALNAPKKQFFSVDFSDESRRNLEQILEKRFQHALDSDDFEADEENSTEFLGSISSGLEFEGQVLDAMLKNAQAIVRRERRLFGYLLAMIARSATQPVDSWPTIFVNTRIHGKPWKLRYDWLTWLTSSEDSKSPIATKMVKATGEPLNTLDDVVGFLPPTLQIPAIILYYKQFVKKQRDAVTERIYDLGSGIRNRDNWRAYERFRDVTLQCLGDDDYCEKLAYGKLYDKELFDRYLRFWLRFVTDIGPSVRYLYLEHGVGS